MKDLFRCPKCGVEKPPSEFYRNLSRYNGLSSSCKECSRISTRAWAAQNKARVSANKRRYYLKYRERIIGAVKARRDANIEEARRAQSRRYRANREHFAAASRRRMYGITHEEYLAMIEGQGGKCAICGSDSPGKRGGWHVDHSHKTGTIRGLLCSKCNLAIGLFGDSAETMTRAIEYIERGAQQ